MPDIRIDRYIIDAPAGNDEFDFAITDVGDMTKAFVKIIGANGGYSAGPIGSTGNANPRELSGFCYLLDTSTIRVNRHPSSTGGDTKYFVEVWVYTGPAGGAYEFIHHGHVAGALDGTSNTTTQDLTLQPWWGTVLDVDKLVPVHNGTRNNTNSTSQWNDVLILVRIDGSDNLQFRTNANANAVCTTRAAMVEFTGSAWNVYRALSFEGDLDTGNDVDGNPATAGNVVKLSTHKTGNLPGFPGTEADVGDWSTAMIFQAQIEGDTAETGLSDTLLYVRPDTGGTDEVRFTLDNSNSRNDGMAMCTVLQCDDLKVDRGFSYDISEGNNGFGTSIAAPAGVRSPNDPSPANRNEFALEWMAGTQREGTAHARGRLHAQIGVFGGSDFQVQHWIHRSGNIVSACWAFVDLIDLVDPGSPVTNISATLAGTSSGRALARQSGATGIAYNVTNQWEETSSQLDLRNSDVTFMGYYRTQQDRTGIMIPWRLMNGFGNNIFYIRESSNNMQFRYCSGDDGNTDRITKQYSTPDYTPDYEWHSFSWEIENGGSVGDSELTIDGDYDIGSSGANGTLDYNGANLNGGTIRLSNIDADQEDNYATKAIIIKRKLTAGERTEWAALGPYGDLSTLSFYDEIIAPGNVCAPLDGTLGTFQGTELGAQGTGDPGWVYPMDPSDIDGSSVLTATLAGNAPSPISATLAGTSSLTATISAKISGSSNLAGSSTLNADLDGIGELESNLSGTSTLTASITGATGLSATLNGTSTLTATIGAKGELSSTLVGGATLTATVRGIGLLTSTLNGTSTLVAAISGATDIGANLTGSSDLSATIGARVEVSANLAGSSTLLAAGTSKAAISATLAGGSVLTATVRGKAAITADLSGTSTFTADARLLAAVAATLAGTSILIATGTARQVIRGFANLEGRSFIWATPGDIVRDYLVGGEIVDEMYIDVRPVDEIIIDGTTTFKR